MQIIQERDWTYKGRSANKFVFESKKDEGTELHTLLCKVIADNKKFVAYLNAKQDNVPIDGLSYWILLMYQSCS